MDVARVLGGVVTIVVILNSVQVTAQILGEAQQAMRCVGKLLPCEPYIHLSIPPPPWCCSPLKEIVEKDVTCLCAAFNHPDMLRFIALTKESALNLLRSCGVNHDLSRCNRTDCDFLASSVISSSPAELPEAAANGSNSASTKKNEALAVAFFGFSFAFAFLGMIFF